MFGIYSTYQLPQPRLNKSLYGFGDGNLDSSVIQFLSAVNSTGQSFPNQHLEALQYLTSQLKEKGLWDKMLVIYPFCGGTAQSHALNLKDPRYLNAAFQITWFGGVTHSLLGARFNGVNSYGETSFVLNNYNRAYDVSLGAYTNVTELPDNTTARWILGSNVSGRILGLFEGRLNTTLQNSLVNRGGSIYGGGRTWFDNQTELFSKSGMLAVSRKPLSQINQAIPEIEITYNGWPARKISTFASILVTTSASSQSIKIGCNSFTSNLPNQYWPGLIQFVYWGIHLNETEMTELAKIVETYQQMMNRSFLQQTDNSFRNITYS